ncbi:unnamed protein product [Schistosoma intercalatum]|nr:unnamed protein product [Schistosoma intercalatum]
MEMKEALLINNFMDISPNMYLLKMLNVELSSKLPWNISTKNSFHFILFFHIHYLLKNAEILVHVII